METEKNDIKRY